MVKKGNIVHSQSYCPFSKGSLQKKNIIFSFTERDINKNHELKLSLFTKFSVSISPDLLIDFTLINYKMLKNWILLSFLLLLASPMSAQGQDMEADSVYEFRFVPQKDMFFVPYGKNRAELERLSQTISRYRREIADGSLPLYVDGYCSSRAGGEAENMAVARLRSNRVKSELILRQGMTEKCFITRNHAKGGDYVTVKVILQALPEEEAKGTGKAAATRAVSAVPKSVEDLPGQKADKQTPPSDGPEATDARSAMHPAADGGDKTRYAFALRANLLRWATLTPDLGKEWRINRNIGSLVNASWTSWSWDDKNRRYALWKVSPEVRYYMGKEKRGYLGAMYHTGEFNYKLGETGRQGDYQGGGITGGYQLKLNRALSLDFHAGLGYTRAEYDKYKVMENVRVRQGSEKKDYWGINQLGVTLVWKIY